MLKKVYEVFGFVVLIKQIFTFQIPFFSIPLLGRDINIYLLYILVLSSLALWTTKTILNNKVSVRDLCLLIYIAISIIVTLIFSWTMNDVLSDAIMFMMPVVVYAWYNICKPNLNTYLNVILIVSILSGVLSVLISLGIINVNIWAAEGDLVRAAGAISSTFGVGAFIITMCLLFLTDNSWSIKKRYLLYASLIGSIVTVLLSFSRTRWVICAFVALLICLLSLKNANKTRFGFIRISLFISILVIITIIYQPDIIDKAFDQMMIRFDNVQANDHSITYRFEESNAQFAIFKSNFILGAGWGVLSYNDMYIHNLYASLPAQSGVFSLCYFVWMFSFLTNIISRKYKFNAYIAISLIIQIVLIVLNVTNGGIVVSGGYFLLIYVFILDDTIREKHLKKKGDILQNENRHINLS